MTPSVCFEQSFEAKELICLDCMPFRNTHLGQLDDLVGKALGVQGLELEFGSPEPMLMMYGHGSLWS